MKHWIKLLGVISVLMICLLSCNKQNVNKIKEQNTVNEDNNKITESVEKSKITIMSEKQNRADLCTRIIERIMDELYV